MRKSLATVSAFLFAALLPALAAHAQSHVASVGGRNVQLVMPEKHCALDRANASDARVIALVERLLAGQNVLHLSTTDCDALRKWRGTTKTLSEYTQVQSLIALKDQDFQGKEKSIIQQICAIATQQGGALTAQVEKDMQQRIEAGKEKIKLEAAHFLGVLGEDDHGCYVAMLIRGTTETGAPKAQLCIFANVVLQGKLFYLYRYSDSVDTKTVQRLFEDRKAAAKAHVDANGGTGRRL